MKSLVDVRAALDAWARSIDINVPVDVVPLTAVVGNFDVINHPHGSACDAEASTTIRVYVSRAEEASAHEQADRAQTELPDQIEAQQGGPWLSLRCNGSRVTEETQGEAQYVVVVFDVVVWV